MEWLTQGKNASQDEIAAVETVFHSLGYYSQSEEEEGDGKVTQGGVLKTFAWVGLAGLVLSALSSQEGG